MPPSVRSPGAEDRKLGGSRLLEEPAEQLPDAYRTIFKLCDLEDMSTTETPMS